MELETTSTQANIQEGSDTHTKKSWLQEKREKLGKNFAKIKDQISEKFTEKLNKAYTSLKTRVSITFKDLFKNSNREDAKDKFLKQALTPQTTKPTAPGPHSKGP